MIRGIFIINNYHHSNHSKYLLQYHIVLVTKYRKPLFNYFDNQIKQIIERYGIRTKVEIKIMESDINHIHILLDTSPDINLKYWIINLKKSVTVELYKDNCNKQILSSYYFNKHKFFSSGYFITSIGNASESTINNYIENQG